MSLSSRSMLRVRLLTVQPPRKAATPRIMLKRTCMSSTSTYLVRALRFWFSARTFPATPGVIAPMFVKRPVMASNPFGSGSCFWKKYSPILPLRLAKALLNASAAEFELIRSTATCEAVLTSNSPLTRDMMKLANMAGRDKSVGMSASSSLTMPLTPAPAR